MNTEIKQVHKLRANVRISEERELQQWINMKDLNC